MTRTSLATLRSIPVYSSRGVLDVTARGAFCIACLNEDIQHRRLAYGRRDWLYAWRTCCLKHQEALCFYKNKKYTGLWDAVRMTKVLHDHLYFRYKCNNRDIPYEPVRRRFQQLLLLEKCLVSAFHGRPPPPALFGKLGARAFLQIFHDVSTAVATNFARHRARPFADHLTVDHIYRGLFNRPSQLQSGYDADDVCDLTLIANPADRRANHWAAYFILAVDLDDQFFPEYCEVTMRRRYFRNYLSATHSEWFFRRMGAWPASFAAKFWD